MSRGTTFLPRVNGVTLQTTRLPAPPPPPPPPRPVEDEPLSHVQDDPVSEPLPRVNGVKAQRKRRPTPPPPPPPPRSVEEKALLSGVQDSPISEPLPEVRSVRPKRKRRLAPPPPAPPPRSVEEEPLSDAQDDLPPEPFPGVFCVKPQTERRPTPALAPPPPRSVIEEALFDEGDEPLLEPFPPISSDPLPPPLEIFEIEEPLRQQHRIPRFKPGKTKMAKISAWEPATDVIEAEEEKLGATPVPKILRGYQKACIDESLWHLKKGVRRQAVSLPVGSGKTFIFSNLIASLPNPTSKARKTLVLAHREELLDQAGRSLREVMPNATISYDKGVYRPDYENSDIIVASVQTLSRSWKNELPRLKVYDPSDFKCIIIENLTSAFTIAHELKKTSYRRILEYFNALSKDSHILVWGCSATLRRYDGQSLGDVFDKIVFHCDFEQMVKSDILVNFSVQTVSTKVDLAQVPTQGGDFILAQLAQTVDVPERNKRVVEEYKKRIAPERKRTLVFAVNRRHIANLTEEFRKAGIPAESVDGETRSFDRLKIRKDFEEGKIPVLVNCGIMTEGVDIPAIDAIILARPTRSDVLLQQMIGRGVRRHEGKRDCLVVDFVDLMDPNKPLATVPTLMGLRADFTMYDDTYIKTTTEMRKYAVFEPGVWDEARSLAEAEELARQARFRCQIEQQFRDSAPNFRPFSVNSIKSDLYVFMKCSSFNWVRIGPLEVALILPTKPESRVTIEKTESNRFRASFSTRFEVRKHGIADNGAILEHDTLESAIRATDTWVARRYPHLFRPLTRGAPWRKKPAGPKQIRMLQKLKVLDEEGKFIEHNESEEEAGGASGGGNSTPAKKRTRFRITRDTPVTRGLAADLITRYFCGAARRASELAKEKKAAEKKKKKGLWGGIPLAERKASGAGEASKPNEKIENQRVSPDVVGEEEEKDEEQQKQIDTKRLAVKIA
ncbi:hypothetical protein HK102_002862 [Quaeritorhiza haematococci]|nr:hypothetical protein HK102_002862 [Quaeritorhiza haematococci]